MSGKVDNMTVLSRTQLAQVASPAQCFDAMKELFLPEHVQALSNLNAYLHTWTRPEGLGGIISTWWSSTIDTIEPHPMNQAPYILGAARLMSAGVPGNWRSMIEREAFSIASQTQSDGLLRNGWGDMPGYPLAPVIGFSAAGGLYAAAAATQSDEFLHTADRIRLGYERAFSNGARLYHGVANQSARWTITILQRYLLLGDQKDLEMAVRIGDSVLNEQIQDGPNAGAIYQGSNSDILISVYVGKCLYALLALFHVSGEKRFYKAASDLGRYMISAQAQQNGLFVNALEPAGRGYRVAGKIGTVLRRAGVSSLWTAKIRRQMLARWDRNPYPVAVARAGDSIRGLCTLSAYDPEIRPAAQALLTTLLEHQACHGGFPNTVGYSGAPDQPPVWQDKISPTRWNAYVFQLLSELVAAARPNIGLPDPWTTWPGPFPVRAGQTRTGANHETASLVEDAASVRLISSDGRLLWCVNKGTGETQAEKDWRGELTTARSLRQMAREKGQ